MRSQLDADWKATKEHFMTQNTKLFKLVPDVHSQLFKVLEDQIRTVRLSDTAHRFRCASTQRNEPAN
jgi:hypothetical protein